MTDKLPSGAAPAPSSTGFVLCERVLAEFRGSRRSPSLANWEAQLKSGLEKFLAENPNPRAAREAQTVQRAFGLAQELAELMKREAGNSPAKT